MDSGLSARMEGTLNEFLPKFAAAAPPKHPTSTTAVDLSTAQNELIRPELLELFKSTVENEVAGEVYLSLELHFKTRLIATRYLHYQHPMAETLDFVRLLPRSSTLTSTQSILSSLSTLHSQRERPMLLKV
jgi:hypothetical protein